MLLIEYVGHIGLRSLTDGHLGRHLEYFKTLNDARVASVGFYQVHCLNNKNQQNKNFKIKFQVTLVFYPTIINKNNFALKYQLNGDKLPCSVKIAYITI